MLEFFSFNILLKLTVTGKTTKMHYKVCQIYLDLPVLSSDCWTAIIVENVIVV